MKQDFFFIITVSFLVWFFAFAEKVVTGQLYSLFVIVKDRKPKREIIWFENKYLDKLYFYSQD